MKNSCLNCVNYTLEIPEKWGKNHLYRGYCIANEMPLLMPKEGGWNCLVYHRLPKTIKYLEKKLNEKL